MLYLEDYLEMIEHLPQELRDRFTEMREMDLSVQNNMDTLEKRVRVLFGSCRRGEISKEQAEVEFADIKKGYNKTLEEADEKVALSNQMYELVDRYLRRLDTELHKFKCELEADNKGITEVLEKRSLDLDVQSAHTASPQSSHYKDNKYRIRSERRRESWNPSRESRSHSSAAMSRVDSTVQQAILSRDPYNVITQAANQAIAASQQIQHGRRSTSVKAYDTVGSDITVPHYGAHALHDHGSYSEKNLGQALIASLNQSSSHGHHTTVHGHSTSSTTSNKRHNKQKKTSYSSSTGVTTLQQNITAASRSSSPSVTGMSSSSVANTAPVEEALTDSEWNYDPNEPRYCLCHQVSYGDMVACDNVDCPYEWFHYSCVGINSPPKGKWYCPQCNTSNRRNRTHRKN